MEPIIALWSHPRSMSTAMERIMRERGDCRCFHEPFICDYYVHRAVRSLPLFDVDPDQPAHRCLPARSARLCHSVRAAEPAALTRISHQTGPLQEIPPSAGNRLRPHRPQTRFSAPPYTACW